MINKRWYDSDPILKEALELLRLQPEKKIVPLPLSVSFAPLIGGSS